MHAVGGSGEHPGRIGGGRERFLKEVIPKRRMEGQGRVIWANEVEKN